ncbi:MAG: hypothetical protein JNM54_10230 [Candidatus Accumulibacter sp.]|uniref:hypothetical protein n=1 Tax=Accumulibacter sp. TaxID=2053492 RepID=UPI001A6054FC|nr:hypothetical protein [Accumulibacter sp.]MBL8368278.1 hypothetical protein [Accumulibacter sp.]MBN8515570.1 hypothetical protein [Accumulibacter sp.]MBO3703555.1 hypothetical protein [Accumulibacter sp.]
MRVADCEDRLGGVQLNHRRMLQPIAAGLDRAALGGVGYFAAYGKGEGEPGNLGKHVRRHVEFLLAGEKVQKSALVHVSATLRII